MKPQKLSRAKDSRQVSTSPVSRRRSSALRTVTDSRSALKGLTRKSKAPSRIASTAVLIEPCAVMTMTSTGICCALTWRRSSSPLPSGSCTSSSITSGTSRTSASRAAAELPTISTAQPARARYSA